MNARTSNRHSTRGTHRSHAVLFEAVEPRQMMSISATGDVIASHAGAPRIPTSPITLPKGTSVSQNLGSLLSGTTQEDLSKTGSNQLPTQQLRESLLSPANSNTLALPTTNQRQRDQVGTPDGSAGAGAAAGVGAGGSVVGAGSNAGGSSKQGFGASAPNSPGRLGAQNTIVTNAQAEVNPGRTNVNTSLTETSRTGGANVHGHAGSWSNMRSAGDIGAASLSSIIRSGRAVQQMDGASDAQNAALAVASGAATAAATTGTPVGAVVNAAATAADVYGTVSGVSDAASKPEPLGVVSAIAGAVSMLTNLFATAAEGAVATTPGSAMATSEIIAAARAGAIATGASAAGVAFAGGVAIGTLIENGTGVGRSAAEYYGASKAGEVFRSVADRFTPDPNSTGGDGTATILISSKLTGNKAPSPNAGQPPENGYGTFGGTVIGGAEQVVKEIKGTQPVRTPGSVDPNRINPAPESSGPVHNTAPPQTGNINTWVGQPGGPRI